MSHVERLALDVLLLDADLQPRDTMSSALIKDYAALYAEGHTLAPISVMQEGDDYWVWDGFHRCSGARQAGLMEIDAEVEPGTKRDAVLRSCGANKHGKVRTNDDKRRVVQRLLDDPEWGRWSNVEIARYCGVDEKTVRKYRREASSEIPKIEPRLVERGGTTYEMDTTRIGHNGVAPALDVADDLAHHPEARLVVQELVERGELALEDLTEAEQEALWTDDIHREEIEARFTGPALVLNTQTHGQTLAASTFNQQKNDLVDWAKWSWNPVTGCLHDCDYCYARDIANRYYAEKFAPTFRPERLSAPYHTRLPREAEAGRGWRNVFVCSMADLFGKWVPDAWIEAVLAEVRASPQWTYLFLTKFPQRLAEIDWPDNAWVGTTVDRQYRVSIAEKAFRQVRARVKWLSCEPLLEDLTFTSLAMFDWVVLGGASKSTQTAAFQPPWPWVEHLLAQARAAQCQVYFKDNLHSRPREYPYAKAGLALAEER